MAQKTILTLELRERDLRGRVIGTKAVVLYGDDRKASERNMVLRALELARDFAATECVS